MLDELQSRWQNLTPEMRAYVLDGALALGALLGGHWLGKLVGRFLRARRFDVLFRVTAPATGAPDEGHGITPTMLAGLLVRLTAWAFAAWWLLPRYGQAELAQSIPRMIGRVWIVAAGLTVVLALAGVLARRVTECLEGVTPANRSGAMPGRSVAGAVGAGIYVVVLLLALLTAADYFDWTLTRNAAAALWQLALHLLTAGAAVLVGYVGVHWARETANQGASPALQPAQQTALGIVAVTTALAVALLLFGSGLGVGVAILAAAVGLLFLARGRLPDVTAGLKLRRDRVGTVWFDGTPWQVGQIGIFQSLVVRNGENYKVPNRQVLEACGPTPNARETSGRAVLTR
jgi:hypothetical protein